MSLKEKDCCHGSYNAKDDDVDVRCSITEIEPWAVLEGRKAGRRTKLVGWLSCTDRSEKRGNLDVSKAA